MVFQNKFPEVPYIGFGHQIPHASTTQGLAVEYLTNTTACPRPIVLHRSDAVSQFVAKAQLRSFTIFFIFPTDRNTDILTQPNDFFSNPRWFRTSSLEHTSATVPQPSIAHLAGTTILSWWKHTTFCHSKWNDVRPRDAWSMRWLSFCMFYIIGYTRWALFEHGVPLSHQMVWTIRVSF